MHKCPYQVQFPAHKVLSERESLSMLIKGPIFFTEVVGMCSIFKMDEARTSMRDKGS
jgi:hypothetical protein